MRLEMSAGRPFGKIAWTGGERPCRPSEAPEWQVAYAKALFAQSVNAWCHFWKDEPDWDTLRAFYRHSRYDSYATFRHAKN